MSGYINYQAIGIACGIGFLAYCFYFDRKRRSDPNYRDKVIARREEEKKAKESQDEIVLPPADDKAAIERFFIKEIEVGEELIQAGDIDRAVKHLSYAVALCPQPKQLLQYLREILPTDAYGKLIENLTIATERINATYKKDSKLQEDDVE